MLLKAQYKIFFTIYQSSFTIFNVTQHDTYNNYMQAY